MIFEQPVTERVRSFLRLDHLFQQLEHHCQDNSTWGRRAAVHVMLDLLTLFSRGDLRKEVAKELSAQREMLQALASRDDIDHEVLRSTLDELQQAIESLSAAAAQSSGSLLRESDFLLGIINRSAIPGGTCAFDLPGYQRWLLQGPDVCAAELEQCLQDVTPYRAAIALFLRLLRQSAPLRTVTAENGIYTETLSGTCRLIRIVLPETPALFPEISAGRQRFTLRLMALGPIRSRHLAFDEPTELGLALCCL